LKGPQVSSTKQVTTRRRGLMGLSCQVHRREKATALGPAGKPPALQAAPALSEITNKRLRCDAAEARDAIFSG